MYSLVLCTCLANLAGGQADQRDLVGLWELTYYGGLRETNELWTHWIFELSMNGDKLQGRVLANSPAQRGSELERVEWKNGRLLLTFTPNAEDKKSPYRSGDRVEFDGVPAARPENGVVGIIGVDYPARMVRRDSPKVAKDFSGRQYFAPLQKAATTLKELRTIVNPYVFKDKAKHEAAIRAGDKVLDRTIPQLEEALKDPDSRAGVEAALFLVRQGVARKQPVARLTPWARAGEQAARHYGPRHHAELTVQLASAIPATAESAPLILELSQAAEKSLDETHPLDLHCRALWVKDAALRAAGDQKGSERLNEAWQKMEKRLQDLYRERRPLPKLAKFEAPPIENERPAVLNLVEETPSWQVDNSLAPAQAAFDGLAATFKDRAIFYEYSWFPRNPRPPARLVHPGAIAWDAFHTRLYVAKKAAFPVLHNGQFVFKLKTSPMTAQEIYDVLYSEMEAELAKKTPVKLSATATRRGDKIEVQAKVQGLTKPVTVTALLAEEWAYVAKPGQLLIQRRAVRAKHDTGSAGIEFDLAKLERDLAPLVEDLPAWDLVVPSGDPGASRGLVRARRWSEPYVIVMVWIPGELQQAVQVKVAGI